MTEANRLAFLNSMFKVAAGEEIDNQRFWQQFLDLFSETEDNLSCLQHLEIGKVTLDTDSVQEVWTGLKLKNRNLTLSYVIGIFDDYDFALEPIPQDEEYLFKAMDKEVESLSKEEWRAILHFLNLFMSILDKVTIKKYEETAEPQP